MTDTNDPLIKRDAPSTVLEKIPPDRRRQIDLAVIDRDPPAIQAVFDKFSLAEDGVSRSAFYRYARRTRLLAITRDFAELAETDQQPVFDLLPVLLGHRLLDALADENTSPRAVQRLTDAWRAAVRTRQDLETHQVKLAAVKKREDSRDIDDLLALTKRYGKFVQQDNRNRLADAMSALRNPGAENATCEPTHDHPTE